MKNTITFFLLNFVLICSANAQLYVQGLMQIQNGAEVFILNDIELQTTNGKIDNLGIIEVEGNWTKDMSAEYEGNGGMGDRIVIFKNDQFNIMGDQIISGDMTGDNAFFNIEIDNSGANGIVQLNDNISVDGTLNFVMGNLLLNDNNILLEGQITNEREVSRITGTMDGLVIKTMMLSAPTSVNPGNIGAEITSTANLGMTTISRGHKAQTNGSNEAINRFFDIEPTNDAGLNATLRFYYFDAELNGITETELNQWRNDGSGWVDRGFTLRDGNADFVELDAIDAFSRWTLTNLANALPVELVSFRGEKLAGKQSLLSWVTASEINNYGFEIERSINSRDWETIGFIEGKGTTSLTQVYSFIDKQPQNSQNYYRLHQIDFNGQFEKSDIILLNFTEDSGFKIGSFYPNPSQEQREVSLQVSSLNNEDLSLEFYDTWGRKVKTYSQALQRGTNLVKFPLSRLSAGIYTVRINMNGQFYFKKLVIQ